MDGNYTKIIRSHYVDTNNDGVCDKTELIEQEVHNIEYNFAISNHLPDISSFCFSVTNSFTFTQLFNLTYVSKAYGRETSNLPSKMVNTVTRFYALNQVASIQRSTYHFEYPNAKSYVVKVNVAGVRENISLDKEVVNTKIFNSQSTLNIAYRDIY